MGHELILLLKLDVLESLVWLNLLIIETIFILIVHSNILEIRIQDITVYIVILVLVSSHLSHQISILGLLQKLSSILQKLIFLVDLIHLFLDL